jgi:hypothetical protein
VVGQFHGLVYVSGEQLTTVGSQSRAHIRLYPQFQTGQIKNSEFRSSGEYRIATRITATYAPA